MDWNHIAERFIDRLFDPVTITAISLGIVAIWTGIRKGNQIEKKIDDNTKITVDANKNVSESVHKIGSAVKEEAKQDAQKMVAVGIAKVAEGQEEIRKQINGNLERQIEEMKRASEAEVKAAHAQGLLEGKKTADIHVEQLRQHSDQIGELKAMLASVLANAPTLHESDKPIITAATVEAIKQSGS